MNDRSNFGASSFADEAAAATAAASVLTEQLTSADLIRPTLNEGTGVWMDQVWDEKKNIPHNVLRVLKEVEACVYGAKTITGLLFADEVHADDARINPAQVVYTPLSPMTREGLRVAAATLFNRATFSLESLRTSRG